MCSMNVQSAERQKDIEVNIRDGIARVYLRTEHEIVTEEVDGKPESHWSCTEAFMEGPDDEAPDVEEIEADFESWFEYVAAWKPARQKNLAELQADVEFIAAMTGIDLEV